MTWLRVLVQLRSSFPLNKCVKTDERVHVYPECVNACPLGSYSDMATDLQERRTVPCQQHNETSFCQHSGCLGSPAAIHTANILPTVSLPNPHYQPTANNTVIDYFPDTSHAANQLSTTSLRPGQPKQMHFSDIPALAHFSCLQEKKMHPSAFAFVLVTLLSVSLGSAQESEHTKKLLEARKTLEEFTVPALKENLQSRSNVEFYVKCVVGTGPCNKVGIALSNLLAPGPQGATFCGGCTDTEKVRVKVVLDALEADYKDLACELHNFSKIPLFSKNPCA
ncbi:uncharacterized protein LOC134776090 [Penaeus indicus]|uniref:uncharacterized protein LOC134776090 n=1 Tax=Penaeus indicus TaxID=29960 RepID=UPI00300CEE8C